MSLKQNTKVSAAIIASLMTDSYQIVSVYDEEEIQTLVACCGAPMPYSVFITHVMAHIGQTTTVGRELTSAINERLKSLWDAVDIGPGIREQVNYWGAEYIVIGKMIKKMWAHRWPEGGAYPELAEMLAEIEQQYVDSLARIA